MVVVCVVAPPAAVEVETPPPPVVVLVKPPPPRIALEKALNRSKRTLKVALLTFTMPESIKNSITAGKPGSALSLKDIVCGVSEPCA